MDFGARHLGQHEVQDSLSVLLPSDPAALLGHVWTLKSLSTASVQYNLQCYTSRRKHFENKNLKSHMNGFSLKGATISQRHQILGFCEQAMCIHV